MTINWIANQGDRLDQIVQDKLGSLSDFETVLQLNSALKNKIYLEEGDIITLPIIEKTLKVEDELW